MAMKDALTKLYNRKAFDLKLANSLKTFEETGEPFALIVFDIDKFKEINDTLGHVAGDRVLEKVAQCLRESFRDSDFIARYGGDEFIAVIEKLTKETAREKVLSFRRNLAKRRFVSHKQGKIDLNVSSGIAVATKGDTPASLIERADKAMYAAKRRRH
jgi:diguanylate cyclase (GGDEF)-like protein